MRIFYYLYRISYSFSIRRFKLHQKEAFRDIDCFLMNMDEYLKKRIIKHLFKAVGDRAGPEISERPHNDGELLCCNTLKRLAQS